MRDFYQYIRGWDLINVSPPVYRERIRGYFPPEVSAALWSDCYENESGDSEVLTQDCEPLLHKLDVRPTLHSIRTDATLINPLQFWVGQNLFALQTYPAILARADAAIVALDRKLGAVE
ncbi:MAG TPA: hypothetical protein VFN25_05305 [Dokdonella sp.]|nr:hypothetical protein [Dokdonella sp.]